jgi:hypothetical protein
VTIKLPRVTLRAAQAVSRLMEKHGKELPRQEYVPLIGWVSDSTEPDFVPGPCLAVDRLENIPSELVVEPFGVKPGFILPEEKRLMYENSQLDYIDGDFFVSNEKASAD